MKYFFFPILLAIVILTSCKKDSNAIVHHENPNNELKATVSVIGETSKLHHAKGDHTIFNRRIDPNGDSVITVSGSIGEYGTPSSRKIEIWLINIQSPGTYNLNVDNSINPRQKSWCVYTVGDIFFSTIFEMYFSDRGTPPGSVSIDLLTATEIRGSFTANCSNTQLSSTGTNYAQITNGSFKGTFLK